MIKITYLEPNDGKQVETWCSQGLLELVLQALIRAGSLIIEVKE